MLTSAFLLGLLVAPLASAQEYSSDPALLSLRGSQGVVDQTYEFPLVIDVGFIVDEIGVVARATAGSNLLVEMEGESDISWPDPNGVGDVVHRIRPLNGGSRLAMTADVDIGVDFLIGVFGSDYSFSLLSRSLTFTPEVNNFQPFLLPDQSPNSMRIDATPENGGFELPFGFNLLDTGVFGLYIGVVFTATPETFSVVRGISLNTLHDGDVYRHDDPADPSPMWLYENSGRMDMESEYVVDVTTQIGYRFVGSGGLTISILGQDIPITIQFLNQYVNLFAGVERPSYTSGIYSHDLPLIDAPVDEIDFGTIEKGSTQAYTLPINNDGALELEVLAGAEGAPEFTIAPATLFAEPGGQDAAIVTFAPLDTGDFEGTIVIKSSDPLTPELRIPVIGKAVRPDKTNDTDDNNGFQEQEPSTIYAACGCASSSPTGGLAPFALLLPLIGLRRRRAA